MALSVEVDPNRAHLYVWDLECVAHGVDVVGDRRALRPKDGRNSQSCLVARCKYTKRKRKLIAGWSGRNAMNSSPFGETTTLMCMFHSRVGRSSALSGLG